MRQAMKLAIDLTERGWVPDPIVRRGIRSLIGERLSELNPSNCEATAIKARQFVEEMNRGPIAPLSDLANEQHYEVPAEFFAHALGPHRKYSSCFWDATTTSLADAEARSLALTCEHAALEDGQRILELGCGWGSLTLWMAAHYPNSTITAVSNSNSQREYILGQARERELTNINVITEDMNRFHIDRRFDRIVSVEMFEHMRNYQALFERISNWLTPDGRFLMHIFCHRTVPYAFEVQDESDWMSKYFFSGGIMPSDDLPLRFQNHLALDAQWRWSGTHYQRTAEAWLQNMTSAREQIMPIFEDTYGVADAQRWWVRWRLFFAACAELFGYEDGQQWWVSHYAFSRRSSA